MEVILCRMVRGSSADQRSANRRLSASFIARGRTQITPRDRIQISKTSSLQSHRQMGVMKQDCSNRLIILEPVADFHRPKTITWSKHSRRIDPINRSAKPFCQGEDGAIGLSRMPMA